MTDTTSQPLREMLFRRIELKTDEERAIGARREIDAAIADAARPQLADGKKSVSIKFQDDRLKLNVSFGTSYTTASSIIEAFSSLPANLQEVFSWKPDVIEAKWAALSAEDKLALSKWVTSKPSSPSVKIEVL